MQKRYTTWNEYLRGTFGEKFLKFPLMLDLTVPIGMELLHMAAVHFVLFLVLEI